MSVLFQVSCSDSDMIECITSATMTLLAPFLLVINYVLIYFYLGASTLVGAGFLCLAVYTMRIIAVKQLQFRRAKMQFTDARVKSTNELLQSMKAVKLNAWEQPLGDRVREIREQELQKLRQYWYFYAVTAPVSGAFTLIASVLALMCYGWLGYPMDAATIFTATALFMVGRSPFQNLPRGMGRFANAVVSLGRLQRFLLLPMKPPIKQHSADPNLPAIEINSADFMWATQPPSIQITSSSTKNRRKSSAAAGETEGSAGVGHTFSLHKVNIHVRAGSLCAIVGPVGSGKSSLLNAILGEMPSKTTTEVIIRGSIAYVPQQAYIVSDTIRANILFGQPYEPDRYAKVLDACCLTEDLAQFSDRDLTELGERGITLSGGQRQRVSMARAMYSLAEIVILDDPFSALDTKISQSIFTRCLLGPILANRTCLLVTNQVHFLAGTTSLILVIDEGRIADRGTHQELIGRCLVYQNLMKTSKSSKEKDASPSTTSSVWSGSDVEPANGDDDENSRPQSPTAPPQILYKVESRETGSIPWAVYREYFLAGCKNWPIGFLIVLATAVAEGAYVAVDGWLTQWVSDGFHQTRNWYIAVYALITLSYFVLMVVRSLAVIVFGLRATTVLHNRLFAAVLRAPMNFFETTRTGQITNRFTKDLSEADDNLTDSYSWELLCLIRVVWCLLILSINTPIFLLGVGPALGIFYFIALYYARTGREMQRINAVSLSPIFSHFHESLLGTDTIRAYRAQNRCIATHSKHLREQVKAFFWARTVEWWLRQRVDLLTAVVTLLSAVSVCLSKGSVKPETAGFALAFSLNLVYTLSWTVRFGVNIEAKMASVERMIEYSNLPSEENVSVDSNNRLGDWPRDGRIEFKNVSMRYRDGLSLAVQNLSVSINSAEHIGIFGQTGSGKSSIIVCLTRLVNCCEGSIFIDATDIATVPLLALRSNLTIIPQEPLLFSGSLRSNLDMFNEFTDNEIWAALERCQMRTFVEKLPGQLGTHVEDGGHNFSVGQRQLLSLARATQRRTKILIFDEATASVDPATDALLQQTLRRAFDGCTTLIIAHRLDTIVDCHRVLGMENSRCVEFGRPAELIEISNSLLSKFVDKCGPERATALRQRIRAKAKNGHP